jgi:hypothetical protein
MVAIQQLQLAKVMLELDPPDVKSALIEIDIAITVLMQKYASQNPVPPSFPNDWEIPVRPNDKLLKEFGW